MLFAVMSLVELLLLLFIFLFAMCGGDGPSVVPLLAISREMPRRAAASIILGLP